VLTLSEHSFQYVWVPHGGQLVTLLVLSHFSAQRGHDDDVSSTSEDDGYPEDMDQDKHDDSTDDSAP
jgi:hypothetical protein